MRIQEGVEVASLLERATLSADVTQLGRVFFAFSGLKARGVFVMGIIGDMQGVHVEAVELGWGKSSKLARRGRGRQA